MKHYFACILLLLMPVSLAAQGRLPTLLRSTQNEEASRKQRDSYGWRRIFSLEFRGNQYFSSESLSDVMKSKQGEPYLYQDLYNDMFRLRMLVERTGYLKASVGQPEIEETVIGTRIVVPINEGVLYRWGTIKVEGATVFNPEGLNETIGLKSGEIADVNRLMLGTSRLEELYREHGYAQFAVFIEEFKQPSPDAEEGCLDITLKIEEGDVFRINLIQFKGNRTTPDRALRDRLLIHEGDIYNDSLIRKSLARLLARLNALRQFEEVTHLNVEIHNINVERKEVDIIIRVPDAEEGSVDITLKN